MLKRERKNLKPLGNKFLRLEATKTGGVYQIRSAFEIKNVSGVSNGLKNIHSVSRKLDAKECKKLAKKLGWLYKKPPKVYHLIVENNKITSGYVMQDHVQVKLVGK